jgi:hypothetical protein
MWHNYFHLTGRLYPKTSIDNEGRVQIKCQQTRRIEESPECSGAAGALDNGYIIFGPQAESPKLIELAVLTINLRSWASATKAVLE